MFEIFEKLSQSLPNRTSLFVQLPFYDVNLYNKLIQQEVVNYDKITKTFELPTNRLFFLVKTFITIDDVGFTPYKEPKTVWKKIGDYDFKKATPFPYQREGIEYGLNHDGWLLLDDCGLGKMEPVSSLIPTVDGFKRMGEIQVGDRVFGSDGKVCNVLNTYNHKNKDIYRVTFSDGVFVDCGLEHLWKVRTDNMKRRNQGWAVLSTQDIVNKGLYYKNLQAIKKGWSPRYKWEIPTVEPVQYPAKEYYIHPYVLGVCIGNGSLAHECVTISIADIDIEVSERVTQHLDNDYKLTRNGSNSCPRYTIVRKVYNKTNNYIREIARLGLNVTAKYKFIPRQYLLGSVSQRTELLRGLMDTDGTIAVGNKISYSTTSSQLADDMLELVNSLGGIAKKHTYDRNSEGKGIEYVVSFNLMINPFYLKRKADRYTKSTSRGCHRYIKNIEFNRKEDAKCLAVDSYDNTYLTSNRYVVTHNTIQMIYLAQLLHEREGLEHCLIICGVNGLKYNWAGEIAKFTELSYRILGQRTNSKGKQVIADVDTRLEELKQPLDEFFIITNLETLQKRITPSKSKTATGKKVDKKKLKPAFVEAFNKSKNKFDMIVLDEAHKCKDSESLAGSSLLKLKSKRNIALTGTLIINNPENAYVPLKWTGNLNCTKTMFNKMYNVYGGFGGHQVIGYKNLDLLQEHIASCSLRRLKEEVLPQLPKKIYKTEYVELLPKQRQLYDEVELAIAQELDLLPNKQKITIQQEMVMNMRLRQITAYPGILSSTVTESAKLDRLEDLVEEIVNQGDKVVVFGTFVPCMAEVNRRLQKYSPIYINENSTDYDIDNAKHTFETDDKRKVFVATWQKMGTGHTLTAANYVIFIDTPWTDGDFDQSADRIYRIGQTKNCIIITLVAKDTYDERVKEIIEHKEALSNFIVDSKLSDKLTQLEDIVVDES